MNIKDVFWKWKRMIRKNREEISRAISITLIVALIAVVGYAAYSIYQSDLRQAELAKKPTDKTAIKATSKYDYGEPGFNKVAENANLILAADFTTGEIRITEKATGKEWYSNPQDRAGDKYAPMIGRVHSQIHVRFLNAEKCAFSEFDNWTNSIKKGRMTHELIENGVKFTFGFPIANVYIPVQYTLNEDGFQAEIVTSEIKGVGGNPFVIESIALLPYFGAGGLEDEGYLFVPDGSGSLIQFNNNKQSSQVVSCQIYGENTTALKTTQGPVQETAKLPVFGAKCNDGAFLGVILTGQGNSSITAVTSKKDSSYNHVYASGMLGECGVKFTKGNHEAREDSYSLDYAGDLLAGKNYAVRYYFLDKENADYTGMCDLYREILEESNQLKDSSFADKKYVVLDLVGAVSIEKYVVGIKMPVVTALTKYNDVCEIVKELKAQGVENLIINYIGALDGGLNNKIYNKVSPESALGTKKEFKNMISYLEKEGVILLLETNPVDLYNDGNGYKGNRDSAKSFFDQYSFQYNFDLDLDTYIKTERWRLIRPQLAAKAATSFTDSAVDWKVKQISLARVGDSLYSDYIVGEKRFNRNQAMEMWDQTLKTLDEKTECLMVHGGFAYCLPYADVITDVSDSFSNYDMQNTSIPFYQMLFQDRILLTSAGINTTVDYEYSFLKALETGSSLKYNLIYGDVSDLVGTEYNTMVSYSYNYWKDTIVEQYHAMQKDVAQLAGKKIVGHTYLEEDVTLTKYESAEVVVNYGEDAYTYNGKEIAARSYLVLSGGAK